MKLDRVEIKNFRSIKDTTVNFEPACRVLVGINESGKSNILNALAFLDEEHKPVKKDDLREALPEEEPVEESHVRFIFKFEKPESDKVFEDVSSKILAKPSIPIEKWIASFEGKNIIIPERFVPTAEILEYHNKNIFQL